ncbi:MAG: amidohydrolase family protein, partial [Microbacterium sp.]
MLDLLIGSTTVVDGTGAPAFPASVGVDDGKVVAIRREGGAPGEEPPATKWLDGRGLVLAPGFIDVHNHSDLGPLVDPTMPSTIRQGVTTVVVGNCGMSPFPSSEAAALASWAGGTPDAMELRFGSFGGFLARLDATRPSVHVAALI